MKYNAKPISKVITTTPLSRVHFSLTWPPTPSFVLWNKVLCMRRERERERAQEMKPIDVLSTFFHMPNVVLPKRIKVPKARRSRIQVVEMKRWPHTYSYRQTTLDHFESRSMFCPNSFGMKVVNFKRKDPTPHLLFNFPFSCGKL